MDNKKDVKQNSNRLKRQRVTKEEDDIKLEESTEGAVTKRARMLQLKEEQSIKDVQIPKMEREVEKLKKSKVKSQTFIKPMPKSNVKADKLFSVEWDLNELISYQLEEPYWAISNVVTLLESDHTVPFIARYRKEKTNNMEVNKIREAQVLLMELRTVQSKAHNIAKQITNQGKMSDRVNRSISQAQSADELDNIFAPYKTGSKSSLAERARKAGLEPVAKSVLDNRPVNFHQFIRNTKEGCSTFEKVKQGVQHIIADIIAKDKSTMDQIRELTSNGYVLLVGEKSKSAAKLEKENKSTSRKFETYYNFKVTVQSVKPHQVLALNRGDAVKELTVRLEIPKNICTTFIQWCHRNWIPRNASYDGQSLLKTAVDDAYKRLIQPLVIRKIRSELTRTAERASVEVFSQNLKRLLLTPPVRGKVVIGLDPGFVKGCKLGIISGTGAILHTDVIFLMSKDLRFQQEKLVKMFHHFRCETVAIGNGTACRETEKFISDLISKNAFSPLNVMYSIVNEDGASIYSVSDEAQKEMPDLDPNVRSAVSIARRLQDPLVELVKNDPRHIGVGMYQHDMPEKSLKTALDGVVEDCVSFVGVDLNVCTDSILRRIAGLSSAKAKKIIEFREKNGSFINREQLLEIKGLGPKSYEQCAGFVRISGTIETPSTMSKTEAATQVSNKTTKVKTKKSKPQKMLVPNSLDRTWIHPESYAVATQFLDKIGEKPECIGLPQMRNKIDQSMQTKDVNKYAEDLDVGVPTMQLIIDGLKQPLGYDIRAGYDKPLFKKGIMSIDDLKCGSIYSGRVTNQTHFGAFVDIGVQINGLIHTSHMPRHLVAGGRQLGPGDKVEVKVLTIEKQRQRIGLQLVAMS